MGQYIRWQVILAVMGTVLLGAYLSTIGVAQPTEVGSADDHHFYEGLIGNPQYLNPLLAGYNPIDQDIAALIFEGLVRDDGFGNLEPVLADNWTVSEDGRIYTFSLRRDVTWSDGRPFTSDDVFFTFQLIQADDFPGDPTWRALWQTVQMEQLDPYQIRFQLTEPFPAFPYYTTVGILPHHILQTIPAGALLTDPFNLQPIGTGPFKLTEATDQYIRLAPNERYRQTEAHLNPFEFRFYPTSEALFQAFQQQEIDGISRASLSLMQQLFERPDLQFFSAPLPRYEIVYFNLRDVDAYPFFQDKAVRQALFQAIDRQNLIDQVLLGQAILARGPFLPWSWAFNPNQNYVEFDPKQAGALLDQAGWQDSDGDGIRDKDGTVLRFKLLTDNSPTRGAVATDLVRQWQALGIDVTVEGIDQNPAERLTAGQFEAALIEVQLFGDPDPYSFWHQTQIEGGQNFAGWDNTEASEALEAGRMAVARGDRIKAYYQFQDLFAEEMPALILYHPVSTYAVRDSVKNVQLSALTSASDRFRNVLDWQIPAPTEDENATTAGEAIPGN